MPRVISSEAIMSQRGILCRVRSIYPHACSLQTPAQRPHWPRVPRRRDSLHRRWRQCVGGEYVDRAAYLGRLHIGQRSVAPMDIIVGLSVSNDRIQRPETAMAERQRNGDYQCPAQNVFAHNECTSQQPFQQRWPMVVARPGRWQCRTGNQT